MSGAGPESVDRVFDGTRISVEVERWPGGARREIVRHPGAAAAVVRLDGDVVLVRQFREAVRRVLVEIPAGTKDVPGETSEDTIRREIREETGYEAISLERVGSILTTPGFTDERIDLYAARVQGPPGRPEEEGIEVLVVPFDEAVSMAEDGRIEDAKSVAALLLLARRAGPSA